MVCDLENSSSDSETLSDSEDHHERQSATKPLPLLVEDYIYRGEELEDFSIYELACLTCPKNTSAVERERYIRACESLRDDQTLTWNHRVFFQSTHSKAKSRWISFLREPKVPCITGNSSTSPVYIDSSRT
jgi:hypothetical protein